MVQLQILSGKRAGFQFVALRLPLAVGRSPEADLCLDEPGVFPVHLTVRRERVDLVCEAQPDALLTINGGTVQRAVLRNGDVIGMGSLKVGFALAPARQGSLLLREWLTWAALALLCVAQIALIYTINR